MYIIDNYRFYICNNTFYNYIICEINNEIFQCQVSNKSLDLFHKCLSNVENYKYTINSEQFISIILEMNLSNIVSLKYTLDFTKCDFVNVWYLVP